MAITSQYNPFTFQEMLQSVQIADEQHKAMEEQMASLATEASVWDSLANNERDREAYNQYKAYAADLDAQVEELARSGLNSRSRQGFNNMRVRYGSEIAPIGIAYETRNKLAEEQRNLRAKDPTAMFDFNADELSLGQLMKNPSLQYRSHSGSQLTKAASDVASNFQRELRDPNSRWRSILGNQFFEKIDQYGLSMDTIMRTIQNEPGGNEILKEMGEQILSSSGISDWNNQDALNVAKEYINQGLFSAVGPEKIERERNELALIAAREASQRRLIGEKQQPEGQVSAFRPIPHLGVDKDIKTTQLDNYSKFLTENSDAIINNTLVDRVLVPTTPGLTGGGTFNSLQRNDKTRLSDIAKEVGFEINTQEDINNAINILQNKISTSVQRQQDYIADFTDNSGIAQNLRRIVEASSRNGYTPVMEIKDNGKVKETKHIRDGGFNPTKAGNPGIINHEGIAYVGWIEEDDKGKVHKYIIEPYQLDGYSENMSGLFQAYNNALDMGDREAAIEAQSLIENNLRNLNMSEQVRGNTNADVGPVSNSEIIKQNEILRLMQELGTKYDR